MKYLREFQTVADYNTAKSTLDLPNVSLITETNGVEYKPYVPPRPTQIITYEASAKLPETTEYGGLKTNAFNTTIKSHTFENGVGTVEFNDDVTSIGMGAFYGCRNFTNITIPDSVTEIGAYAFGEDYELTSIELPSSVTSIGEDAFYSTPIETLVFNANCDTSNVVKNIKFSLKNVTIGCPTISGYAFNGCTSLSSVTVGSGVTAIDNKAFYSCANIQTLNYNSNVEIPNQFTSAFKTKLKTVVIGNITPSIGNSAFKDCTGLTSCTIGSGVTSIGESAFAGCSSLKNITIPNGVTSIGNNAFNSCTSLTSVIIPDSVTSIGYGAFAWCTSLTSCTMGSGVTSIGMGVFGRSGLKNIVIPDNITTISKDAFSECSSLKSVTMGSGVTSIGSEAFSRCTSLTSITCNATTAPTIESMTFFHVSYNGKLYVPTGSTGYDVWMGTGNYYLGQYGWTKVEQ